MALLPLIALSAVVLVGLNGLSTQASDQVDESRRLLSDESIAFSAEEQAVSVAREVNATLLERIEDVTDWARNDSVVNAAETSGDFARTEGLVGTPIEDLEAQFASNRTTGVSVATERFLRNELLVKPEFQEVFFTDANGFNAAVTHQTSDFVQSDEEWWQEAWANGISVSDVEFDESAGVFSVDISVRIDDPVTDQRLGVMKAVLGMAFVQSVTTARSLDATDYIVALSDGRLIAETASFHKPERMMNAELPPAEVSPGLVEALASTETGSLITEDVVAGYTRTDASNFLGTEVRGFKGFDWIVMSDQRPDVAFAPLRGLEDLNDQINDSESSLQGTIIIVLLLGLVSALVMSRLLSRNIVGPIQKLTSAASDAATSGLPTAVSQIEEAGADADSITVPELELATGDELEQLASSFNSVQGTALRLASEQALSRRNTSEMFVNLGRRNNSLLKRQLRFIDGLERNEADPETLESLFKLDHLATRMRRNAESLLVLAGERSPRRWSAPVPMKDSVQAALAEVEEYERVDMHRIGDGMLQGNVVADIAHIMAELIENALNFSPPQTMVMVNGRMSDSGYTLTVTDEGLGMGPDEFKVANERLSGSYDLSSVPTQSLGLYVVGRLASQHDIKVSLGSSPSGGTTATVVMPSTIIEGADADEGDDDEAAEIEIDAEVAAPTADETDEEATAEADDADAEIEVEVEATADSNRDADEIATRVDDADAGAADARRSPDEAPAESVMIGDMEIPRRRRESIEDEPAEKGRADEPEPNPVEAKADRSPESDAPDLAEFGFVRRRSDDRSDTAVADQPAATAKGQASAASANNAERADDQDVEATASASRNQWSSFQRGKEAAETPADGTSTEND